MGYLPDVDVTEAGSLFKLSHGRGAAALALPSGR